MLCNNNKWWLTIFTYLTITQLSNAKFYNGRFKPGKVGEPQQIFEANELISVAWAEMKVNNFGSNGTWQNVTIFFFVCFLKTFYHLIYDTLWLFVLFILLIYV